MSSDSPHVVAGLLGMLLVPAMEVGLISCSDDVTRIWVTALEEGVLTIQPMRCLLQRGWRIVVAGCSFLQSLRKIRLGGFQVSTTPSRMRAINILHGW